MQTLTEYGWTDVDLEDVAAMRECADWIECDGPAEWDRSEDECSRLADDCRRVARLTEMALIAGDSDQANHEAAQWPDAAGPWC